MSETAAPAAPAGATTAGPQTSASPASPNGSNGSNSGNVPLEKPSAPRANDGRFLPKESNQHPPTKPKLDAKPDAPKEPAKEPLRFKRKLNVYGKEEEVDLDEEGLARELQKGRAYQLKAAETKQVREAAAKILQMAENPEEFLRAKGVDPDEWARQRLARMARLETMSEPEREALTLREENALLKAEFERHQQTQAEAAKKARQEQLTQRNVARYREALKHIDLPDQHEALVHLLEVDRAMLHDTEGGVEYSPEELARETARMLDERTERYLLAKGKAGAPALVKALKSTGLLEAVLESVIADATKANDFAPPRRETQIDAPTPEKPLTAAEVDARLRAMRQSR